MTPHQWLLTAVFLVGVGAAVDMAAKVSRRQRGQGLLLGEIVAGLCGAICAVIALVLLVTT
jgi:hypothetical protein